MNEVKKVILFCYAVLYLLVFMHRKHAKMLQQRNGGMSRPKIKDGGKIQNIEVILCLVNGMRL